MERQPYYPKELEQPSVLEYSTACDHLKSDMSTAPERGKHHAGRLLCPGGRCDPGRRSGFTTSSIKQLGWCGQSHQESGSRAGSAPSRRCLGPGRARTSTLLGFSGAVLGDSVLSFQADRELQYFPLVYRLRSVLLWISVPFLAVVGLAFRCVWAGLRFALGLVGWELAWPPVLVDDLETETSSQPKPEARARRSGRRRGCG